MKSNDKKQDIKSKEELELLKRKKFLNKMAMATAFVGVTSIGGSNLVDINKTLAIMKPTTVKPIITTPSLKPGGLFVGSNGGYRPVSSGIKLPTSTIKPTTSTTKPTTSTIKPTINSNNTNLEGTGIKPGNTSSLVNKFENISGGGKPTAPSKPNISSSSGTTSQSKPSTNNSSQTSKPNTNVGSSSNKQPVTTQTGSKPNSSGTSSGSNSSKPTLGGNTSKPNSSGNGSQGNKTNVNDPDGSGTSGKPTLGGNTSKPSSSGNGSQGNKTNVNDPDGPETSGNLTLGGNASKPNSSGNGNQGNKTNVNDPDGIDNNRGSLKGTTTSGKPSSSNLLEEDGNVNSNKISTVTNSMTNSGNGDRFGKIVGVIGLLSTAAFLGTSIASIIQGQQSLDIQQKLQQDSIKAQEELEKNKEKEEYEKLAAQLGGKYDPDRGVIVLPNGSELNVVTGIVTYPDGSWVDQNGNLHLPDGSGVIKPDGEINIDGIGTLDKDGNLVLDDGSGYFDSDGNFHSSGSINSIRGVSGGVGYGGMYIDSNFGGNTVINQSINYGAKAYDQSVYDEAITKASSHKSVEDGVFTTREYDSIVNLIVSSKINTNVAKNMVDSGQLTQEQLSVVLELLDIYEKSGKI